MSNSVSRGDFIVQLNKTEGNINCFVLFSENSVPYLQIYFRIFSYDVSPLQAEVELNFIPKSCSYESFNGFKKKILKNSVNSTHTVYHWYPVLLPTLCVVICTSVRWKILHRGASSLLQPVDGKRKVLLQTVTQYEIKLYSERIIRADIFPYRHCLLLILTFTYFELLELN